MPDNDPAGMAIEDRDMNDRRKLKKRGKKAAKADRTAARSKEITDNAPVVAAKDRQ